jgi:hypothetical protein
MGLDLVAAGDKSVKVTLIPWSGPELEDDKTPARPRWTRRLDAIGDHQRPGRRGRQYQLKC